MAPMERTSLETSNMIEADTWDCGQRGSRSWAVGVPPGKEMRLNCWDEKANNKKKKKKKKKKGEREREKENPQLATDSPTERKNPQRQRSDKIAAVVIKRKKKNRFHHVRNIYHPVSGIRTDPRFICCPFFHLHATLLVSNNNQHRPATVAYHSPRTSCPGPPACACWASMPRNACSNAFGS